ncbi:MAG: GNAT family N-acetyltransferase [Spirochaetes bacterium]|nr:GNAT family N-acetyltransferase [Spirochaetota bacterium]
MKDYTYRSINKNDIFLVKNLWSKLNDIHHDDSIYFKDHFASFTFEKRITKFADCGEESIMIQVAESDDRTPVGYCISTVDRDGVGEIDSIFVDDHHRGNGIGDMLMRTGISWLRERGCAKIRVGVAHGHESVFLFYQRYGFFPRMTFLEMK